MVYAEKVVTHRFRRHRERGGGIRRSGLDRPGAGSGLAAGRARLAEL